MHTITVEKTFATPIDKVWALVADFANLDWYSPPEKVEKIGTGIGETRRITMPGLPLPIDEILESIDHEAYRLSYRVAENALNPMLGYVVQVTLNDAGDGHTLACWHGNFDAVVEGFNAEDMVKLMHDTYTAMLEEMATALV